MASGSARIGGLATSEPRYSSQRNASNAMPKPVYMNGYVEDTPNNYWDWRPSSTFMENPQQSATAKSTNKNTEQRKPLPATPTQGRKSQGRRHTPATFPRTKYLGSGREKTEMESLRQHLTFSDMEERSAENGLEGASMDLRSVSQAGYRQTEFNEIPHLGGGEGVQEDTSVNDMPNRNQIVARLVQIREYIKQASSMLSNIGEPGMVGLQNEQIVKLGQLQEHLKEQERGYLILLERMLGDDTTVHIEGRSSQNSGESFATSIAESASINVDARSDISEASTVGTYTAKTRPRIESTMGTYASDSEILSDVERDEDIMSVDSEVTGSFGLDTGELHEQYSSLLAKYNPKEDSSHSRDSSAEDLSVNGLISSSNNSQNDVRVKEQMEALAGLQQQHDLLRKMLQQQEELRNLQNRQTSLMKLQEQIESRLADNETSTEATPSEVSHQTEDSKTMTETSTIPERDPQSETESERYKVALQDLRKRTLLRMLNEDRDERLHQLQADTRMDLQQREQEQVQLMNHEQKDLQEKLQHLQQKKDDMDLLLHQLHSMAAGAGIMDAASSIDPASEAEGSQIGRNFASGGGGDGVKLEGTSVGSDSLMKLQEVRHRLTELQGLVQEYQGTTQESTNNGHDANYEDPELMSNLRKLERGELIGRYRGIHVNNHNQASTQTVGPPLINQSEDETQGTPSVTEEETETENESEQSSVPVAWAEDPELREKFRKLETAKQKLRELQKLVSIVQELPEAAMGLPDDLAELAMSLTEEVSEVTQDEDDYDDEEEDEEGEDEEQSTRDEESVAAEGYSELSEGEVSEQTREAYYEAKMRQQRRELEKLMEERGQLLNVQRQLKELNQKLPPISMINNFTQDQHQLHARYLPPTNPQDSLTPSRDEVYAEMRRHKILQEELRQKKRELAALVAKVKRNKLSTDDMNDLEDNDLFSRVSMRSADVTAAATWGGSSQMSDYEEDDDETNDAYRGRRGLAEEEEEEEVEGNSIAMTSDTYTVEEPRFNPGRPSILANESDYDESLLEMHGIRYPGRFPRQQYLNPRQENLRAPEDLVEDMSQYSEDYLRLQVQVDHLQDQLEDSVRVTQALVKDQHAMMHMLHQNSMSGFHQSYQGLSPSPLPSGLPNGAGGDPRLAELLHNYDLRLQHQQLMLNLNNAYNDLFKQQEALENFYSKAENTEDKRENLNSNNSVHERLEEDEEENPYNQRDIYSPYGRPGQGSGSYQRKYGLPEDTQGNSFNLAPTFPPEFSESSQRDTYPAAEAYLNQYDSFSRQQASRYTHPYQTTTSYHVPPNSSQRSFESNELETSNAPIMQGADRRNAETSSKGLKKGLKETREVEANLQSPADGNIPRLDINSLLRKTERQRLRKMEKDSKKGQPASASPKNTTAKRETSASSQAKSKMAARSKLTDANFSSPSRFRPGLSSHLSGTAFLDTASMASTMSFSSMPGELDQEGMRYLRPVGNDSQRSVKTQSEVESEAGSEYSLFEALRESIYSEVATLISQNESRPHFLIELFRELQMLSTDYLRQRALYALQDLVSKFLTEDNQSQNLDELTKTYLNWPYSTVSEHTPSESFFTSEEEEIKAQLYGQRPGLRPSDSKGSLNELEYDYAENVESASSMSTPPSIGGPGDFGFANDELGNTVIHLDKALQRMREYERMKAEAEASGGTTSSAVLSNKQEDAGPSASDVTSNSSAQDMGSESSFSDLPYPRIDTRQLDLQIKSIMQEVIPYLKEHMDDVCSTQLLAYIRRLVMNLARQRDDSREFVRFFNRQLGSILEDSLSKFSGRKMRESGEDLLVDISEILFNELAFFRLMQDLDTAGDKLRKEMEQEEKKDTTEAEESKDEEQDDDEEDEEEEDEEEGDEDGICDEVSETTGTETGQEDVQDEGTTDNTSSDDEEENEALAKTDDTMATVVEVGSQLVQEAMENAMTIASKFEAEELGNERDDMFAAQILTSETEEDSEPVDEKGMKIELSMSESKAVTYLGSEEDDNDQDEVSHNNEETETSLGMSSQVPADPTTEDNPTSIEEPTQNDPSPETTVPQEEDSSSPTVSSHQQDPKSEVDASATEPTSIEEPTQNDPSPETTVPQEVDSSPTVSSHQQDPKSEVVAAEEEEGEVSSPATPSEDSSKPKGTEEEAEESEVKEDEEVTKELKTETDEENKMEEVSGGGELKDANENEVTIDDLPAKLTSLSQMDVEAKMEEEASGIDPNKAILESMVTGEEQLAGDGEDLPEPEGAPAENGVLGGEAAST
ncbi:uncharacterized protein [Apostichopus japonicus]|uniref:uncharacterized protein isoform X3 n=1 Tax=Stichopus japonicus TaxID=307972 RepID=UPI003AB3D3CD